MVKEIKRAAPSILLVDHIGDIAFITFDTAGGGEKPETIRVDEIDKVIVNDLGDIVICCDNCKCPHRTPTAYSVEWHRQIISTMEGAMVKQKRLWHEGLLGTMARHEEGATPKAAKGSPSQKKVTLHWRKHEQYKNNLFI